MADPDRRPTAQEIEELIDLVRRDPASPAFIDLAEAYLALGRPRDAVEVCNLGLEAAPDNLESRVVLARAYAALHQWKEAQGELLRVVKVDRSSRTGFALLGEVLLRRQDYERAVPVLQHAQNLDPTSANVLALLRRARAGLELDPPPPIPTPVPPRGESAPTRSAQMQAPPPPRPGFGPGPIEPLAPLRGDPTEVAPPSFAPPSFAAPVPAPPPPRAPAASESTATPGQRPHKPTAPPAAQPSIEGVRPRVMSTAKPQNAAAASLRQSAAIGENYLNDLLTGGLLDVAGVRVPEATFDLRPDRRWGRSTRRAFAFLFVVLILGIGGGGGWYYWSEKQKAAAVALLQKESKDSINAGDFAGLEASIGKLRAALEQDDSNPLTFAYVSETAGLEALLYGTEADRVDQALRTAKRDIKKPTDPGYRELVIGGAAVELSRLSTNPAAGTTLGEVNSSLDTYLATHDGDRWARWLKGRALLAAGDRKAAHAMLKQAADGDDGLVVAMIDQADLLVDEGAIDDAFKLFDRVDARLKDHPLAVLGRSMARAEAQLDLTTAMDDLSVKLDKPLGPRVAAYRQLALALAQYGLEDYPHALEALRKATAGSHPPGEPRFWSRVAWTQFSRGGLADAATARAHVTWYSKHPEDDPSVVLVDAGLLLASGRPDAALDMASKIDGVRPRLLRAYAMLDLGKAKDALDEAEEALKKAPENAEAEILRQWAKLVSSSGKAREESAEALEKLARRAKSKLGRHALGMAYLAVGDAKQAQPQLEFALADITDDSPNPLEYRTRTAMAQILLEAGDVPGATKQLEGALKANSGYFPARATQAKVLLKAGDADQALALLAPLASEPGGMTPAATLTLAEAMVTRKGATADDKAKATELLTTIKDKVQPASELARVAALIDPKLPEQLGLGSAGPADAPKAPKAPPRRGRR